MKWVNLYILGQSQGFVYYAAYVNEEINAVVGWVNRIGINEPYAYNIYYPDADRKIVSDTRGTFKHALWAVQGAVSNLENPAFPLHTSISDSLQIARMHHLVQQDAYKLKQ